MAGRLPDATALVLGSERVTYEALNRRANRLARRLQAAGVGPEVLVGLSTSRSCEMLTGLLAILKAGGAYLPLDLDYPTERLAFMLADARPTLLLTLTTDETHLPRFDGQVLHLDGADEASEAWPDDDLPEAPAMDDLAYVIYTSGSTGAPKGVQVTHRNMARLFTATEAWFGFDERDVWTLFHSCAFDFSVWEIWGALAHGGRLVIVPYETSRSPESFLRLLQDEGVTVLNQTPSAFGPLMLALEHEGAQACQFLRYIIFGGEALDPRSLRPWYRRFDEARPRLINMYGITETTVHVTYRPLGLTDVARGGSPIGCALPDLQVHVLDEERQPVPDGEPGELYVGGAGVARGYLNRPDQNAERFVPDPFAADPHARLYRSGDMVRRRPDGDMDYLGRCDQQVKLRGFRIELGEIEDVVRRADDVGQCVVTLHEDRAGQRRLVAYVVPRPGSTAPQPPELRRWAARHLPEHMIPSAWITIPALPLTANGKIDRDRLPEPGDSGAATGPFTPPSTDEERRIAKEWAAVLGLAQVGIHDTFLDLGGDSLAAMQVVNRLRHSMNVTVSPCCLLGDSTVARLAAEIDRHRAADPPGRTTEAVPALDELTGATYPATRVQAQVGFFQLLTPGNRAYLTQSLFRFEGPLDLCLLRHAIQSVVDRHEHFRTTYHYDKTSAMFGEVHPALVVDLPERDLRAVPEARRGEVLQQEIDGILEQGIDPAHLPLARWVLFRTGDTRYELVMIEHHYVHDGWSFRLFLRELSQAHTALAGGRAPAWPAPATQFRQFATWHQRWLASASARRMTVDWVARLADCEPVIALPFARARDERPTLRGRQLRVSVPGDVANLVRRRAAESKLTLFQLMFGAFALLLRRYTGRDDFLLGTSSANRTRLEWESLVGMLVNVVPVRIRSDARTSVREFLATAADSLQWSLERAELPFSSIVDAVRPARTSGAIPLVQVQFSSHDALSPDVSFGPLTWSVVEAMGNGTAKFDLSVITIPHADERGIELLFEYSIDRFDDDQARRIARDYERVLDAIVADPGADILALPMMDADQRHRVLTEWNDTARDFPRHASLQSLFEHQAHRDPEAVAVCAGSRRLTYGDLNRAANRLAHRLRERGVGPDLPVGICLPRSPEMVVAVLAIVKAGGAYVPLDPDHPAERLAFMLADSGAVLVVADHSTVGALPEGGPPVIDLDEEAASTERQDAQDPVVLTHGDHLAYIAYTSGSTGRPKGVAVPQCAVSRLVLNTDYIQLGPANSVAQASTIAFDAATFEIWGALLNGARLAIVGRNELLEAPLLSDAIRRYGIDTMFLTPALFNEHVSSSPSMFAPLTTLLVGGEAMDPRPVSRLLEAGAPRRLLNVYGPTETTTFALWYEVPRDAVVGRTIPIGRPIANTRAYVLDEGGEPLAPGLVGELHIGGPGLARGYVNLPELTEQCFVADPFQPGERLYRTGDRARLLEDGNIEFVGRIDGQIKLRGFRIELGEIESALGSLPGVSQSVVVVRERERGARELVAYYTGQATNASALRAALRRHLPDYMIPSAVVHMAALPLNANGKPDRSALPDPDRAHVASAPPAPEGGDDTAERLRAIWARVLGVGAIGLDDDFFDLGGHSLLALRLLGEVKREFGRSLRLAALLDAPTVASLAALLRDVGGEAQTSSAVTIQRGRDRPPLFFVSGWGAAILVFKSLARALGPEQPLYVLDLAAFGHDGGAGLRLEAVAARMMADMRRIQPHGPYHLAGFSFGGHFVWEIAQQLRRAGDEVTLLALLDTNAPGYPPRRSWPVRIRLHLRHASGLGAKAAIRYLTERTRFMLKLLAGRPDQLFDRESQASATDVGRAMQISATAMMRICGEYVPQFYDGHVVLIAAEGRPRRPGIHHNDPFLGWTPLVGQGIERRLLRCDHLRMLAPEYSPQLAQILAECLGYRSRAAVASP